MDWCPDWKQRWRDNSALIPCATLIFINISDSDDIKNVNLTKVHNLSGPVAVEGAEPGDCLVVDILDG